MNSHDVAGSLPTSHLYTVEIRFFGEGLDPAEITRRLGLTPSSIWVGPVAASSGRQGHPIWGYNGQGEDGFRAEWSSLEEGLGFVVGLLIPVREEILELSRAHNGIWWCGHFQNGFDGGPTLSPQILELVASFGVPIFIDNYFESAHA